MQFKAPRFDTAHILVIGDVMLDRYWHGDTSRISPEAPVPVVRVEQHEDRPGGAANVALNIAALGAGASLVGLVGTDEAADVLHAQLTSAGIHCAMVQAGREPTIVKLRVMSRNQQLIRLDREERFADAYSPRVAEEAEALFSRASVVVLSDYGKGTLSDTQGLIETARKHGKPVLVDPKGSDFARYRGATLLTPNLSEFETIVGACATDEILTRKGAELIETLGLDALLVTRGRHGMTLIEKSGHATHLPARAKEVYDVTGAGDTVISTIAAALAAGERLVDAVALANLAAGLAVAKLGTAAISGPELRRAVDREKGYERGVVTEEQLLAALADARAAGEKIVFTNGCFDILHAGHVGYLEQARQQGDRLVLALNGDASVRRLKGEGRPINPVERRMTVMAALEAVDWVVSFDDDTPIPLIEKIRPEVLVKGGDYTLDQVVGGDIVKAYGGEVKVLSHLDNVSTTAIVDRIKEQAGSD
ncbi:bifunctional D-glycero-beta-D-manno-heptose-7-phosphate kinase/D-glycero-beta-D-manno-heptose 1-phosphate adenylyltransferase HldE [Mesorhizobium sp. CAU 1732]|uniref:bifunctional D-glycero-beta-D-manno-heptose-7-phosphate kinase/D-glycero-beta-D-manno-heptose 1-phosphate adenylyltransferase HldE n=1 Tax=Mesorhizobium sp. CAU 1732 TaxID=3140358 RepID=UPI00326123C7